MKYTNERVTWKDGTVAYLTRPVWEGIDPELALAELSMHLDDHRKYEDQLPGSQVVTFEMLIPRSEDITERASWVADPVHHLAAVARTDVLSNMTEKMSKLMGTYFTEAVQRKDVYEVMRAFAESPECAALTPAEKRIITRAVEAYERSGVALPDDKKARVREIRERLTTLEHHFGENITEATKDWTHHILPDQEALLEGIPDAVKEKMAERAKEKGVDGWMLSLMQGEVVSVMETAARSELRKIVYEANIVRASDLSPGPDGKRDNTKLIPEILALRHELAELLGKKNYAELALEDKIVTSVPEVFDFLWSLTNLAHAAAHAEFTKLEDFAREHLGLASLEIWDTAYVREKMRDALYGVSQEALREYFPESKVMAGLFGLIEHLYGCRFEVDPDASVWRPSVRFYRMYDRNGDLKGGLYTDLYSRDEKRSGAWMDIVVQRRKKAFGVQLPVAYLNANFLEPVQGQEGYVTHGDIETIFHEMGHDLHLLLTEADHISSGMNGVEWDGIELPSQFMENFAWDPEILKAMSAHRTSGDTIPDELVAKLIGSRYFCAALDGTRQCELALTDLTLHADYHPEKPVDPLVVMQKIRANVRVTPVHPNDRMLAAFAHIFAGGYAALYHSYRRAESLSADAFEAFVESGTIVNPEVAERFRKEILAAGSSRPLMESFIAFRGREPSIDALLRAMQLMPK